MSIQRLRGWLASAFVLFVLLQASAASAALDPSLTILSIKSLLESALQGLQRAIGTAGAEVRSSAEQMQANAQNVITDIDARFGKRLDQSVNAIHGIELQFIEDAVLMTEKINSATNDIVRNAGKEARHTIQDTDILAYNAVYSLPCRTKTARVLCQTPELIRVGVDPSEVTLHGNFLDLGASPSVAVDGHNAELIARASTQMVIRVPDSVLSGISSARSISVQVRNLTSEWTMPLLCWLTSFDSTAKEPVSLAVMIHPPLAITIDAKIGGQYTRQATQAFSFHHEDSDGDCGANRPSDKTWCLPAGWRVTQMGIRRNSANCNSSIASPTASGDRCAFVGARVAGCGYDNLVVARNCKGRGWVDYDVTLNGESDDVAPIPERKFSDGSPTGIKTSFLLQYDNPEMYPRAEWTYQVEIAVKVGGKPIRTVVVSNGAQNHDGVRSRILNGALSLEINSDTFLK
jgi:hypothetical protein